MASDECEIGWPLLVAELLALWRRGLRPSKVQPDCVSRALAEAGRDDASQLQSALAQLPAPRSPVRFELVLPTPLWRLGAVAPLIAAQSGGAMACCLRISLPVMYPMVPLLGGPGGYAEVSSPGALGKHAARIITQAAHAKLAESQVAAEQILCLVDWIQGTELHECAAAALRPDAAHQADNGHVRAFVRFHHVLCVMKQCYLRMWAEDLDVAALLAAGQPAMLLVEGPRCAVRVYLDRATKIMHWGPTPARLVASAPLYKCDDKPLCIGLTDVAEAFPNVVAPNGTYNERDCIDYVALADCLGKSGHCGAARALSSLVAFEFAHVRGRVKEAGKRGGWIGYSSPEPELSRGGDVIKVPRVIPDGAWAALAVPAAFGAGDDGDYDPELEEAIRQSLASNVNGAASSAGDAGTIVADEDDPELAEAIRLSLGAASDVMSTSS